MQQPQRPSSNGEPRGVGLSVWILAIFLFLVWASLYSSSRRSDRASDEAFFRQPASEPAESARKPDPAPRAAAASAVRTRERVGRDRWAPDGTRSEAPPQAPLPKPRRFAD